MKKAVVIGSNGQDGTFLVRHLLARGYSVLGISRQQQAARIEVSPQFAYLQADLNTSKILMRPLLDYQPDLIFHVAAVHTSAGGSYEELFDSVLKVNVGSLHTVLEYLRLHPAATLMYASSAKVFGDPLPKVINEGTQKHSQCLYSISKNTAFDLIDYYRNRYAVNASVAYLFNHESEYRGESFFIPKMLDCLAKSLVDVNYKAEFNTLAFYCDWGSAEEYMEITIELLENYPCEDYVIGTGTCTYARELVKILFADYKLDHEMHIKCKKTEIVTADQAYSVDVAKLQRLIKRAPSKSIYSICRDILRKNYQLPGVVSD